MLEHRILESMTCLVWGFREAQFSGVQGLSASTGSFFVWVLVLQGSRLKKRLQLQNVLGSRIS